MKSFEHEIRVMQEHIDELNHVNNVVYLQWIQDVAKAHWEKVTPVEIINQYVWMVLRHEIDYSGQALLGDNLIAKTWVEWSEGVRSERHVEIRNSATQKVIVKGRTLWCLLNANTKRPSRIGDDIKDIFH